MKKAGSWQWAAGSVLALLLFAGCSRAVLQSPPPSGKCLDILEQLQHADDQADRWWLTMMAQEACR